MITPFQEGSVGDVVFNLSVDAIVVMNARGQIVGWNPAAEALFGWPLEEAMSKRVVDLIVPEQFRAAHEAGLKRYRETGEGPVLGKTLDFLTALRRDGSEFPLEIRISHAGGSRTAPTFVAFLRDISQRKWAERHQQTRYAVTRAIAARTGWTEVVRHVLSAAGEQLGFTLAEVWLLDEPSLELRWESAWTQPGADVRPFTAAGIEAGIREGEGLLGRAWQQRAGVRGELGGESEARRRAAEACGLGTGLTAPILGGDVALGVVSFFRPGGESPIDAIALEVVADMGIQLGQHLERVRVEQALQAAQQRMSTELERQVHTDSLTGLMNRAGFDDAVRAAVAHGRRRSDQFALLMLDLDDFKAINDAHGHAAGDRLLQSVAGRLHEALRDSDTIARLGGDEFAVLSAHGVDIDGARHIADNIVRAFEGIAIDGVETPVTLSVGIALFPAHGTDAAPLLRNADAAMYLAKRTNSGHAMFREGLPAGRGASRVSATGGTAPD